MIRTSSMWVLKYLPAKLYGFVTDATGLEVFFHLGVFHPGDYSAVPPQCQTCKPACFEALPPPPILGEAVLVTYETDTPDGKAPRATRVERQMPATALVGYVESMDPTRGYGFLRGGTDGVSYHLHRSEVVDGHIPLPEQVVIFYAGLRQDRPRACHVRVCRWRTPTTRTPTSSAGSRSGGSTSR